MQSAGTRLAIVLAVALPLAAADLALKVVRPTPSWAWHQRSLTWLVLCVVVLACVLLVLRIPSRLVPPAAGLLAAGVAGNALSAAWNDLRVPNPIVLVGDDAAVAFNLADVWVLAGLAGLFAVVAAWLIRNREALPTRPRRRRAAGFDKNSTEP